MSYDTLDVLAKIGAILSGLSLFAGALAAWATLFLINRRNMDLQWVDGFRKIYSEFWKDATTSEVRRWIVSDREYKDIGEILNQRLQTENNDLDPSANEVLEKIDQYCALMLRVRSFHERGMKDWQKTLWSNMYETYWINKTYGRPELKLYIHKYWFSLYEYTYIELKNK